MPIHDWARVQAGVFHHFHHAWIEEITRALNTGLLPDEYYALAEQRAAGLGREVLTLEAAPGGRGGPPSRRSEPAPTSGVALLTSPPRAGLTAETDMEFYRRKQNAVVVRHASDDRIVAMVEVVSPGNKSSRRAMRSFVEKAAELVDRGIHLLILDVHPPTPRDPQGLHGAIWEEISGQDYAAPAEKPVTLAAYESAETVRAYVERLAVADALPEMPLFLEPGAYVLVPLERTYQQAFAVFPRRWRVVLETA